MSEQVVNPLFPSPPVNVRIVMRDGTEHATVIKFDGYEDGMARWSASPVDPHAIDYGNVDTWRADVIPPKTQLRLSVQVDIDEVEGEQ